MHQFSQFNLTLNIGRLPLIYSLGDLSSIREMFTPEDGDIGRTQLPILPPISESILQNGNEFEGYLVEVSSSLMVSIREFLKIIALRQQLTEQRKDLQHSDVIQNYAKIRRECMNRIGSRLVDVIRQERRLGLYNLFWLMISKHIVSLFDRVIAEKGEKQIRCKIEMLSVLSQTFLETIQQVRRYLQQEDQRRRRYSKYIDDTMTSHLGAAFNYELSRSIITDQVHLISPHISRNTLLECAQSIFVEENEKYHIVYEEFVEIYSAVRTYIEKRLQQKDSAFCEMVANVLRVPCQTITKMPIESLVFHPTVVSLFTEDIKQLPTKSIKRRRKTLFKSWAPQLGDIFGEDSWEFAITDYLNFAKDLRRSEIIAFLRNQTVFVTPNRRTRSSNLSQPDQNNLSSSRGIANKISYQFERGRIINDLRDVTLIFLDLRGFTEVSAGDISDQELKLHLYNFFDPVVNIINHFEGEIKTYAGDSILASFGGKREHALNAVRAAIEIQKFFTILQQEDNIAFPGMGIGIHTGPVEETYLFPDLEAPSHNTVIGLSANLVGRLSSGKTEEKGNIDVQAVKSLKEYIQANDPHLAVGSGALAIFEDRLLQAIEALQQQKDQSNSEQEQGQALVVKVVSGVLNNQGIAISNETLKHIHTIQSLQEQEAQKRVQYTYFDRVLQINVTFIKAGDAIFKGIKDKFPVWGVYLSQKSGT